MKRCMLSVWFASLVACSGGGGSAADTDTSDTMDEPDVAVDDGSDSPDATWDDPGPSCTTHVIEEVTIPMRDGESLSALVRRPLEEGCRLPAILIQTPYDKNGARALWLDDPTGEPLFASMDYAFVVVDWRGFFGSADALAPGLVQPYGEDGHDLVEWIADQPWSDGHVGTWGVSALCQQQYRTAVERPPHLDAMVPIFCQMNMTYDQYYPGGVLREEYMSFVGTYFGLDAVVRDHPYSDLTWTVLELSLSPGDVEAPALVVAGWFDLFQAGTIRTFHELSGSGPGEIRDEHRLLIGPWHHFAAGGESGGAGRPLTAEELLYHDGDRVIQQASLAFFDLHLRGVDSEAAGWDAVRWIRSGDREWESSAVWPPSGSTMTFWLHQDGSLSSDSPTGGQLEFFYDPLDPSPTVGGCTLWLDLQHGPTAQDDVMTHPEAVVFVSEPVPEPLVIRGPVTATLEIATTGEDTDVAIRLTDVAPDGTHLLIGEGIQRLKLESGSAVPSDPVPGVRYAVTVDLTSHMGHAFEPGHAVGLIVTASNHPRFAANPCTGDDFIEDAATPLAVTDTLFLDGTSFLTLGTGE